MLGKQASGHLTGRGIDFEKIAVEAIVRQHPITERLVAPLRMPPMTLENFAKEWAAFSGPVKDKTKFTFSRGLHESLHGFVVIQAKWERGVLDVGFMLLPLEDPELEEDELPEDEEPVELWASIANKKPLEDEIKWLEEVWTPFTPVEQIVKTEKIILPNDICPMCSSGKKFKKCCGRFV